MGKNINYRLIALAKDMVRGEDFPVGVGDAQLLINAGLNLQSMDVGLCNQFEQQLGPLSTSDKIAGIAEFHRQILELMDQPIPDRDLDPDPLCLSEINEMPPFRGPRIVKGGEGRDFNYDDINALIKMIKKKRPELIAHMELDLEDWAACGKPRDRESKSLFADTAIKSLIVEECPDIGNADASQAMLEIYRQLEAKFR